MMIAGPFRPPFLFLAPQKEKRAAAGPKRKNALPRSGAVALRADGGLPSRCRQRLPAFCRPAPDCSFAPALRRVTGAAVIGVENRMAPAPEPAAAHGPAKDPAAPSEAEGAEIGERQMRFCTPGLCRYPAAETGEQV